MRRHLFPRAEFLDIFLYNAWRRLMKRGLMSRLDSDVLVIGGGGAGLRAALEAVKHGVKVILVSKSRIGSKNNTAISAGGLAVVAGWGNIKDDPQAHFKDTVTAGCRLNNQRLVEILVTGCEKQVYDLIEFGVKFIKRDSDFAIHPVPGHSYPRMLLSKNGGKGFTFPLRQYAESSGVQFVENILITKLIITEGRAAGALGIDSKGQIIAFNAGAVIVATGGCGHAFLRTNNAVGTTGDGYQLLYEAGIPLQDMEFVQYYPTGVGAFGSGMISYETIIAREEAAIKNSLGEDIVEKYNMKDPFLMTRDRLSRAMMREIIEGRGIGDLLVFDLSVIPQKRLDLLHILAPRGIVAPKAYHVAPTVHFFMGGAVVDEHCQTEVEGLYAAGEVCGGVHGANRLGANSISDIFVFGRIAGENAANKAVASRDSAIDRKQLLTEVEKIRKLTYSQGKEDFKYLQHSMKETMWYKAGILRSRESLAAALQEILSLERDAEFIEVNNPRGLWKAIELRNTLAVSEMICRAALLREESRGAHYRTDFPNENNEWLKNVRIVDRNGEMFLSTDKVRQVEENQRASKKEGQRTSKEV
jgi:fumarate reductase (CoM/CoB) subunit A